MKKKAIASLLVLLQFTLLGILVAGTSNDNHLLVAVFFFFFSVALAFTAIFVMMKSKLRVSPVPHSQASLVTDGPYGLIRHPMYTAILLSLPGFLLMHFTYSRLTMSFFLILILLVKLHWEERMLVDKFPGYRHYQKQAKKLIPYIY